MAVFSWSIPSAGNIDNLELSESTMPIPDFSQTLVRVKAIGLNFAGK